MSRWVAERMYEQVSLCPAPPGIWVGFALAWYDEEGVIQTDEWTAPVVAFETTTSHEYCKESSEEGCFCPQRQHEHWEGEGWVYDGNYVNRSAIYLGESGRLCSTHDLEFESEGPVFKIFAGMEESRRVLDELRAEAITNLNFHKHKSEVLDEYE